MSKVSRNYGSFIVHGSLPPCHARLNFGKSGSAARSLERGSSFASEARVSPSVNDSLRFTIRDTVLVARIGDAGSLDNRVVRSIALP